MSDVNQDACQTAVEADFTTRIRAHLGHAKARGDLQLYVLLDAIRIGVMGWLLPEPVARAIVRKCLKELR